MTFEQWLETEEGQKCNSMHDLKQPYIRNRLYWAYAAGGAAWDVDYTTEIGQLLRDLSVRYQEGKTQLLQYHINKINSILLQHAEKIKNNL